jgi:hypothetical protein
MKELNCDTLRLHIIPLANVMETTKRKIRRARHVVHTKNMRNANKTELQHLSIQDCTWETEDSIKIDLKI